MKSPIDLDLKGIENRKRIIALVDAYDAMTTDRVYWKAIRKEQAIEQIHRCAGTQSDPRLAELFIDLLFRSE